MSYPYSLVTTASNGDTITAADRNAEHTNHITNNIPASIDDYSVSVSQMQTTTDPYPAASESLATTLSGELERLRYLLKQITNEAQWYIDPDTDIATLAVTQADINSVSSALSDGATPASTAADVNTRFDQIVSQLKLITGGANWYTAPTTTLSSLNSSLSTLSTNQTTNSNSISYLKLNVKNILVNGGFEIWQRGTSFSSPSDAAYTADRWRLRRTSSCTFTVSQETTTIDSGSSSLKLDCTGTGATASLYMEQPIENYAEYKSKTVSLSVRVKTSAANVKLTVHDGVGSTSSTAHTGGGSFETLSVTHTLSASASQLHIRVGFTANAPTVSTIYMDSAMLVQGSDVLSFVGEDPAIAQERCERYYETYGTSTATRRFSAQGWSDGSFYYMHVPFQYRTTKAASPTVTFTVSSLSEDGSGADSKGSYTTSVQFASVNGFTSESFKAVAGNRPASILFYWTSEVTSV